MNKPSKVLILGSGALKIGEAGEFDYSGSQAIKGLREEGVQTVLVNPNIATIQTSEGLADRVYFLPVDAHFVGEVIQRERPDGILLGFGGQTALNCGLELEERGILERYGVSVLGTNTASIRETEDRQLFVDKLTGIGVQVPVSSAVYSVEQALQAGDQIGYPVMLRVAYALGGLNSGLCPNPETLRRKAETAFAQSSQILVEEYLSGWKEIEYEVIRDCADNCITVCNMENLDPMGIHTGESIVVAPSQTLSDREYHHLREIAIRVVRELKIVGECNIQFALNPTALDYRVIEVNARLSRSSALASKATGYPLALVASKLALGYDLIDLVNSVTGVTSACFEPALDYLVVKVPRWDLKKFRRVSRRIGSGMKSVGEVMAIGRGFEEALQKALRMLDIGMAGLVGNRNESFQDLDRELSEPTDERIFALAEALRRGYSVERIHELSKVDPWFVHKLANIVSMEKELRSSGERLPAALLRRAKKAGFSDDQVARISDRPLESVREARQRAEISPCIKQIDTLAAEYPAQTNYLYLTYNGGQDDVQAADSPSVLILGSGAYRIGSSVEFDWCCVNAAHTLNRLGYRTIMLNCNPETVSTDYNESDRLYFDEICLETVEAIMQKEKPVGVVTSMGGQTPNTLAMKLAERGIPLLGTAATSVDGAEDRNKFSALLDRLEVKQPVWREVGSVAQAETFARQVGYPVLIRPSYVLSGSAMGVAASDRELVKYLDQAAQVSDEHPVVISRFIEGAKELELDGVADRGEIILSAISEHVENAGVHSGDATLVFPAQRTYLETIRRMKRIAARIARALEIHGPFNIQFIAKDNEVQVIECNLRASRSFPFVSKVSGVNFIEAATRVIMGEPVSAQSIHMAELDYVGVKAPQFSFTRLEGADPVLGVEMASTGEVACLGDDFDEAFLKALLCVGFRFPVSSMLLSTGPLEDKTAFLQSTVRLVELGVQLYATPGTAAFLESQGIEATVLHWPLDSNKRPGVIEFLKSGRIDMVVNIPKNALEEELTNDYLIRRKAVDLGIPLITNRQMAERFVEAVGRKQIADLPAKSWQDYRTVPGPRRVLEVAASRFQ